MRAVFAGIVLGLGLLALPDLAHDAAPPAGAGSSSFADMPQIQLSADQIKNYIASMEAIHTAMGDAPPDAEPDAKTMAKLGAVAKKHGFKDYNDYNLVAGNIQLVLDGIDPESKDYVGAEKVIQKSIAQVKGDKQMKPADKKAALSDLQTQLKSVTPVKNKGNIDLVVKNYAKLNPEQ